MNRAALIARLLNDINQIAAHLEKCDLDAMRAKISDANSFANAAEAVAVVDQVSKEIDDCHYLIWAKWHMEKALANIRMVTP